MPFDGNAAISAGSIGILWAAAAYLAALGVAVLVRPQSAQKFLSAFARTTRANVIEAALRFIVGLAFVGASSRLKDPLMAMTIGWFLAFTALLLVLLPGVHRRFAEQMTPRLFRFFPLFGLVSLVLALALLWFTL